MTGQWLSSRLARLDWLEWNELWMDLADPHSGGGRASVSRLGELRKEKNIPECRPTCSSFFVNCDRANGHLLVKVICLLFIFSYSKMIHIVWFCVFWLLGWLASLVLHSFFIVLVWRISVHMLKKVWNKKMLMICTKWEGEKVR